MFIFSKYVYGYVDLAYHTLLVACFLWGLIGVKFIIFLAHALRSIAVTFAIGESRYWFGITPATYLFIMHYLCTLIVQQELCTTDWTIKAHLKLIALMWMLSLNWSKRRWDVWTRWIQHCLFYLESLLLALYLESLQHTNMVTKYSTSHIHQAEMQQLSWQGKWEKWQSRMKFCQCKIISHDH